jgi:hypothetical protein
MHTISRLCPHCQSIFIPYDGSIVICAFNNKSSSKPIGKKVDGEILSMTMKFITSIRQERISNFVFIHPVDDVAFRYHPTNPGRLESQ